MDPSQVSATPTIPPLPPLPDTNANIMESRIEAVAEPTTTDKPSNNDNTTTDANVLPPATDNAVVLGEMSGENGTELFENEALTLQDLMDKTLVVGEEGTNINNDTSDDQKSGPKKWEFPSMLPAALHTLRFPNQDNKLFDKGYDSDAPLL